MNAKLYIGSMVLGLLFFTGCTKRFDTINQNPNQVTASSITSDLVLPAALHNAGAVDAGGNGVGYNWLNKWMGYWSNSGSFAPTQEESTYNITGTFQQTRWNLLYNNLNDFDVVEKKAVTEGKDFYAGIAKVMKAKYFQDLVDLFGNVPYSQAFNSVDNATPAYDDAKKTAMVTVNQTQGTGKVFRIPLAVDVYEGSSKQRYKRWLENLNDTFYFPYHNRPDLINVDGDKIVLCEKKDDKTLANFIFQYKHAGLYLDRREAIDFCSEHQDDPAALDLLKLAMKDRYFDLRKYAMDALDMAKPAVKTAVQPILEDLAHHDPYRTVQAKAIELLAEYKNPDYKSFFIQKSSDSSYSVAGSALRALGELDADEAFKLADTFSKQPAKGELLSAMVDIFIKQGDTSKFDLMIEGFDKMPMGDEKVENLPRFAMSLLKIRNDDQVKKGIDAIIRFQKTIPSSQRKEITTLINNNILDPIANRKEAMGLKVQADYIRGKIGEE